MWKILVTLLMFTSSSVALAQRPKPPKQEKLFCVANGEDGSLAQMKVKIKKKSQMMVKYHAPLDSAAEGDTVSVSVDGREVGKMVLKLDKRDELLTGKLNLSGRKFPPDLVIKAGSQASFGSLSCSLQRFL